MKDLFYAVLCRTSTWLSIECFWKMCSNVENRKLTLFSRLCCYWLELAAATFPNDIAGASCSVPFCNSSSYPNQNDFLQTVCECSCFCFLRRFFSWNWKKSYLKCKVEWLCSAECLMVKIFPYVAWSKTGVSALLLSVLEKNLWSFWRIPKRFLVSRLKVLSQGLLLQ